MKPETHKNYHSSHYLNTAMMGLLPGVSLQAMNDLAALSQKSIQDYQLKINELENETRNNISLLIECRPEDIAFIPNTSSGIATIAQGVLTSRLEANKQKNIVLMADEYPSNREVWLALAEKHGYQARILDPSQVTSTREQLLIDNIDDDTVLLTVSAIQYSNGYVYDLAKLGEICQKSNIFFMVDAVQICGACPIQVDNIDALVCGGHKWLMGAEGVGFLYVNPEKYDCIEPIPHGWRALLHPTTDQQANTALRPDAMRFETGTQPNLLIAALNQSLKIILKLGMDNIHRYISELKLEFIDMMADVREFRLAPFCSKFEASRSSILLLHGPEGIHPRTIVHRLYLDHNITVMSRGGGIRISPHIYNDIETMEKLKAALKEIIEN